MNRKTVSFNTDEGPNGRRTTCKGDIDLMKYGKSVDLYIRGPKGGLRHVVMLTDSAALLLGHELLADSQGNSHADLVQALTAIKARIDGEWDNPALMAIGPLDTNIDNDVLRIAEAALSKATS